MDLFTVSLLVVFWFVRPQDIIPALAGFQFVRYTMMAAILSMFRRDQGFNLKQMFVSPMDWVMFAYLAWIVFTAESFFSTFKEVFNLAAFYTTTTLALHTEKRLRIYSSVWLGCLVMLVLFGIGSHFGVEVVEGSQELTLGFGDRLALNTWIFNNPNSFGHAVVAVIPLSYAWLWWRRGFMSKMLAVGCMAMAGYCVSLTQSKGAYLAGAGAIVACLLFGKSRKVQLMILAVMMTVGLSAIKLLPRMETLSSKEEGIAGRLLIWQMARTAMQETFTGVGWKQFHAIITSDDGIVMSRPAHGGYVAVGADLGYGGLLLYVGVLYCGLRTLWQTRYDEDEQSERIQRMLLAMLACYGLSAWVLDKAYHTDYFLIAAAISAFHRLAHSKFMETRRRESDVPEEIASIQLLSPVPVLANDKMEWASNYRADWMPAKTHDQNDSHRMSYSASPLEADEKTPDLQGLSWGQLNWVDWVAIFAFFQIVLYLWQYLSTSFISF
jgi:hypothetical protein